MHIPLPIMPWDDEKIFCIACGTHGFFGRAPIFTRYGYKCSDCYIFDIILTPDGVITLPDRFSEDPYSEFYSALNSLDDIDEDLWRPENLFKLPKPKKSFRRRRRTRRLWITN